MQGHLYVYREFKDSLSYIRSCFKTPKKQKASQLDSSESVFKEKEALDIVLIEGWRVTVEVQTGSDHATPMWPQIHDPPPDLAS